VVELEERHLISRFPIVIFFYAWMTASQPTKLSVMSGGSNRKNQWAMTRLATQTDGG
jgi:hypothetical protein